MNENIDKSSAAIDYHTEIASRWQDKYKASPDFIERFNVWTRMFDKYISSSTSRVIDLGCGTGVFSFYLAGKGHEVIGVDGADGMIEACLKEKKNHKNSPVNFFHKKIPFSSETIESLGTHDVIISSSVFEYVEDLEYSIENVSQLLVDDGILAMSFPNPKSIYRVMESYMYKLTGKPSYLSYVKNKPSVDEAVVIMNEFGYKLIYSEFFAGNNPLSKIFRRLFKPEHSCNLYLVVFKKVA